MFSLNGECCLNGCLGTETLPAAPAREARKPREELGIIIDRADLTSSFPLRMWSGNSPRSAAWPPHAARPDNHTNHTNHTRARDLALADGRPQCYPHPAIFAKSTE